MTSYKNIDQVKFEPTSAITWGVKKDKYIGYSIPVALNDDTAEKIEDLVQKHNTKSPLYGANNTIYLRSNNLSTKQMSELYNKGRAYIEVHFIAEGVNTKNDTSYLTFRVTRLRKIEKPESDDPCPED